MARNQGLDLFHFLRNLHITLKYGFNSNTQLYYMLYIAKSENKRSFGTCLIVRCKQSLPKLVLNINTKTYSDHNDYPVSMVFTTYKMNRSKNFNLGLFKMALCLVLKCRRWSAIYCQYSLQTDKTFYTPMTTDNGHRRL